MSTRAPSRLALTLAVAVTLGAAGWSPLVAAAAPPGSAPAVATETGGPKWTELSPSQRKVLAPLAGDWNSIDSRGKERWLGVAGRFHKMPPEEQKRANERMVVWSHMTPAQRTQARLNFQETRDLPKEEREARWKAYQALPDETKRELAAKRAAATAAASAASTKIAANRRHAPVEVVQPKSRVVDAVPARRTPLEPGSTVLRTSPGATTTLLTKRVAPPAHQHDGQPRNAAGQGGAGGTSVQPHRGSQGTVSAASTSGPPRP